MVEAGNLPLGRAYELEPREKMIREFVLQLKKGGVEAAYFLDKFGADVNTEFQEQLGSHRQDGYLEITEKGDIRVTPSGLLRVDSLLEPFFEDRHRGARYT